MQTPNPETPPERVRAPDSYGAALRRTARTTAGPVLLVWMGAAAAEFLVATWLAEDLASMRLGPWWDVPTAPEAWAAAPLAALVLPFLAAFRTAVFRPARAAYKGEGPGLGEAIGSTFGRMFRVLGVRIGIECILLAVVVGCMLFRVRAATFVLLPLAFSLAPALYLASTRDLETGESLWRALEISHRAWAPIYAAHGAGLVAILLFSSGGGAGVAERIVSLPAFGLDTLATLHVLGTFLVGRYLDWLIVTSAYLYLDSDGGAPETDP